MSQAWGDAGHQPAAAPNADQMHHECEEDRSRQHEEMTASTAAVDGGHACDSKRDKTKRRVLMQELSQDPGQVLGF